MRYTRDLGHTTYFDNTSYFIQSVYYLFYNCHDTNGVKFEIFLVPIKNSFSVHQMILESSFLNDDKANLMLFIYAYHSSISISLIEYTFLMNDERVSGWVSNIFRNMTTPIDAMSDMITFQVDLNCVLAVSFIFHNSACYNKRLVHLL